MDVVTVLDDKYEILREIKRGGFGIVYYGRDRLFDKPVAIKAIPPEMLGEARYVDLFQAEALSIARLNHHNVVRIYDIKRSEDGQFYIIMEFVDGLDLGGLIRFVRKREEILPYYLSSFVIAETCAGLEYAHTRRDPDSHQPLRLVHQDISPGNIMINRFGEVKIIDFGLASARQRGDAKLERNEVLIQGKITYIAPEQINGSGGFDHRADIFALGVVFFEALTGHRLFDEKDVQGTIQQLRGGQWDLSPLRNYNVPEQLCQIVERSVRRDAAQRYQNSNQMYLDLMGYLAGHAPTSDFAGELGQLVSMILDAPPSPSNGAHARRENEPEPFVTAASEEPKEASATIATEPEIVEAEESPDDSFVTTESDDFDFVAFESPDQGNAPDVATTAEYEPTGNESRFDDESHWQTEFVQAPATDEASSEPQDVTFYKILEEEEEEEGEVRTIIDVVRLSARTNKKAILVTLMSLIGAALLFAVVDTAGRWTSVGNNIYNALFPPAIRLVSFPPNAEVYLDDRQLPQTTPLAIEKIPPGVHKLMLTLPKYDPIIRSITVPPTGAPAVEGESGSGQNKPFVFRFKTTINVSSLPPAAEVYVNGVKYTHTTPCQIVWEVGDPLHVELERSGLARLTGFSLNTITGVETISDRRLWRFNRIDEQREAYALEGTFAKQITLTSAPTLAEVYLDNGTSPIGLTGYSEDLLLPIGQHTVRLEKAGYLSKSLSIEIDENTQDMIHVELLRTVRIFAKDVGRSDDNDIGARVTELTYRGGRQRLRTRTPCELTLLPYEYSVILTKDGYEDHQLQIGAFAKVAIAHMEPERVSVEIAITDDESDLPLDNVQISYQLLTSSDEPVFFGQTDANGNVSNEIAPGEYRFRVKKFGYRPAIKDLKVANRGGQYLVFRLSPLM